MKRYWDASALIDALQDSAIEKKAVEAGQATRTHTLAEMFSTLTGGRLGFRIHPDDAAAMIEEITKKFYFVDLSPAEIKSALNQAESKGVRGGRVHDWLHAVAAKKSGAQELLTDNYADFAGLEDGFVLRAP